MVAGARTDQTDPVTYTRPGTWAASAGIPGIDQLHSFAADPRLPQGQPDHSPSQIPTRGPSSDPKAPAIFSQPWWQHKASGEIDLDVRGNDDGGQWDATVQEPQATSTQRPLDPRTYPIPAPRWTAKTGPVSVHYMHRLSEGQMAGVDRFVDGNGAAAAFTPSLRPSPMAMGDGIGFQRFRTTQRVSPLPLDQQIVSQDQSGTVSGGVLQSGGILNQRWW